MGTAAALDLTLLEGARALLRAHALELPQRDDLCGAFCGALAMHAAGIEEVGGEWLDQDAVALAAGSVVSRIPDTSSLPHGENGRRDYRIVPPFIEEASVSGTTCGGVVRAISELSGERLAALPYVGPWTAAALDGMFERIAAIERPVALIANVATRHLWGSSPSTDQLLGHLLDGSLDGPPPDWDVGHFVCVVGRVSGPGGRLYAVADTYPALGRNGVHLQPEECLASALQRPGMAPGGLIAVVPREDAGGIRAGGERLGLLEEAWDNGTLTLKTPA
jgi:hypothetical protein